MPKKRQKRQKPELDTTTTFANMNVEGFKWYDPNLEKRRERGAFAAMWPFLLGVAAIFGVIWLLAYLWLS